MVWARHAALDRVGVADPDYVPRHARVVTTRERRRDRDPVDGPPSQAERPFWRSGLVTVVLAAVLAVLLKMFVLQAYLIPSGSMENTLRVGDRVLTNRLSYELHGIHRGDVVVFSGAGTWNPPAPHRAGFSGWLHDLKVRAGLADEDGTVYVKRVIGLPGDTVACCNTRGQVTVNGVGLTEPYIDQDSYWSGSCSPAAQAYSPRCFGPVVVPAGKLWVLGDHRAVSEDSRRHTDAPGGGAVDQDEVLGKAVAVVWPVAHWHTLGTPATFGGVPAVAMLALPLWRRRARREAA